MGIVTTKPVFGEFAINKDADQHVQPSSLISALVNRLLETCYKRNCLCSLTGWYESLIVGNPKYRFSHVTAHMGLDARKPVFGSL